MQMYLNSWLPQPSRQHLFYLQVSLLTSTETDWVEASNYINQGLKNNKLLPVIGKVFHGLASAADAHDEIANHIGCTHGKVIIKLV